MQSPQLLQHSFNETIPSCRRSWPSSCHQPSLVVGPPSQLRPALATSLVCMPWVLCYSGPPSSTIRLRGPASSKYKALKHVCSACQLASLVMCKCIAYVTRLADVTVWVLAGGVAGAAAALIADERMALDSIHALLDEVGCWLGHPRTTIRHACSLTSCLASACT